MSNRGLNRAPLLVFIILLHLGCAAFWSLSIPAFETPDETGHARYVNFLLANGRLPRTSEEAPGEAHQPPLYYLVAAAAARVAGLGSIEIPNARNPAFRWYGGHDENKYLHDGSETPPLSGSARTLHWLRLLSVAMSAGTVALIWTMGSRAGAPPVAAAAAAALAAFIPQFTFIAGSLNNDNLANLLSAAALACLVGRGSSLRGMLKWVAAGLLTGLGLWVKFTGLVMLPIGLIAAALSRGAGGRPASTKALAFLVPALALPMPLLIRNFLVLGDPLGAAAQMETLPQLLDRKSLLSSYFFSEFPTVLFKSFWGTFGWMSFRMPMIFYAICLAATLAGLAGLLMMRREAPSLSLRGLFVAAIALQLTQIVAYNLTFTQAQGRFLFPVIGPITLLLTAGIGEILRRAGARFSWPGWAWLLAASLASANLCILRFIVIPAYRPGG